MLRKVTKVRSEVMRTALCLSVCATLVCAAGPIRLPAQDAPAQAKSGDEQAVPTTDTTVLDPDGTAHITRVLPVPKTVSPEAQARLATGAGWAPGPNSPEARGGFAKARELYPVTDEAQTIAGIPVRVFIPAGGVLAAKRDRAIINLHGGGFRIDASSFLESIPIANLTGTKVISVYYRLASVAPFPAAPDDVVAVYKELLKTYKPGKIVIYGFSAGAMLTAQVAVRLKHDGLPMPAALGFFSGMADFTRTGDSQSFFGVSGFKGAQPPEPEAGDPYMKGVDAASPLASAIFADLHGLPPTLCITGTHDVFLSGTSTFHRALLRAGVSSELVVFDSMPHGFWFEVDTPESKEALQMQADFFDRHLGGK